MRGQQSKHNQILDGFNAKTKPFQTSVDYMKVPGFSENQAKNAVHAYRKGGSTHAAFRLEHAERNRLLDEFNARTKGRKECVDYLTSQGRTYRQGNSAVYKCRQERFLIGE